MKGGPSEAAVREQLGRLLASEQFRRARQLSEFLKFTVEAALEGRVGEIKEASLGVEVFSRGSNFDPRIDPVVRVTARTLRNKLQEYYASQPADGSIIIEYPKGTYVPVFHVKESVSQVAISPPASRRLTPLRQSLLLGIAVGALGLAMAAWSRFPVRSLARETPLISRLTADVGVAEEPSLSSDGKFVAYASDRGGRGDLDIYLQPVAGREAIRLTDDPADDHDPVFSPDGSHIAFRSERDDGGIYIVPVLGGPAVLFIKGGARPRYSADGEWIAYEVAAAGLHPFNPDSGRIYIAPVHGGAPLQIQPGFSSAHSPMWLPGRNTLLFLGVPKLASPSAKPEVVASESQSGMDWWVTSTDGGEAVRTGVAQLLRRQSEKAPVWNPLTGFRPGMWDGNGVIFAASGKDTTNLWKVRLAAGSWKAAGEPEQLTFGTARVSSHSQRAGGLLAFSQMEVNDEIYSVAVEANSGRVTGQPERLTRSAEIDAWPSLSRSGNTMVFLSNRLGHPDIWKKDLLTGTETPLTNSGARKNWPELSPDGREVTYYVYDPFSVARMSLDGRPLGEVCRYCIYGGSTADRSIEIHTSRDESSLLARHTKSGTETTLFTLPDALCWAPLISPDGKWIAFLHMRLPGEGQIMIVPFRERPGVTEQEWIRISDVRERALTPVWSPDGNVLYYESERDSRHCLWAQRLRTRDKRPVGDPIPVLHLHNHTQALGNTGLKFRGLSVAQDKIAFPVSEVTSNIWLLRQ